MKEFTVIFFHESGVTVHFMSQNEVEKVLKDDLAFVEINGVDRLYVSDTEKVLDSTKVTQKTVIIKGLPVAPKIETITKITI